jgi:hypothetical protein
MARFAVWMCLVCSGDCLSRARSGVTIAMIMTVINRLRAREGDLVREPLRVEVNLGGNTPPAGIARYGERRLPDVGDLFRSTGFQRRLSGGNPFSCVDHLRCGVGVASGDGTR